MQTERVSTQAIPDNPPILNELLCPACNNIFTRPKQLIFCGHVFCADCLQKIVKPASPSVVAKKGTLAMTVECPSCKVISHLSNGLQGLRTNLPLFQITEQVRALERWYSSNQPNPSKTRRISSSCTTSSSASTCSMVTKCRSELGVSLEPLNEKVSFCAEFHSDLPQTICPHCQSLFCSTCHSQHRMDLKREALDRGRVLMEEVRQLTVTARILSSNRDIFQKALDDSVSKFALSMVERLQCLGDITLAVKAEIHRLIDYVRSSSARKLTRLNATLEQFNNDNLFQCYVKHLSNISTGFYFAQNDNCDVTKILLDLKNMEDDVQFLKNFGESLPQWVFVEDENISQKIQTFCQSLKLGVASFKFNQIRENDEVSRLPISSSALDSLRDEGNFTASTNPFIDEDVFMEDVAEMRQIKTPPIPSDLPLIENNERDYTNLKQFDDKFYSNLKLEWQSFVRRPLACCMINTKDGQPLLAVSHSNRSISIFSREKLEVSLKIREMGNMYLGFDLVCDGEGFLFFTDHRRKQIWTVNIGDALSHADNVTPSEFTNTEEEKENMHFNGLAVNNDRMELYTCVDNGLLAYNLKNGDRNFFIPFHTDFHNSKILSYVNKHDTIVISSDNNRRISKVKIPHSASKNSGESAVVQLISYGNGDIEHLEPLRALSVDPIGNLLHIEGNELIVTTSAGKILSTVEIADIENANCIMVLSSFPPFIFFVNTCRNSILALSCCKS